jgi:glycosyltransferase involved in cell wall biosynthesis
MRIGCVSDVCLGYGSPQIPLLVESLREMYDGDTLVVEPRVPTLAPQHNAFPTLQIDRARTALDPYSDAGRREYVLDAARILNDWAPELLVICCTFTLPVLFKLKRRPARVIYYSYESVPHYGEFDVMMNRQLAGRVDLVIFPEKNRAALELGRSRFGEAPAVVMYNCPRRSTKPPLARHARNGRILYAGRIDPVETLASYFTQPSMKGRPIDLYGPIALPGEEERNHFIADLRQNVQYGGRLESRELSELRRHYAYSIVAWNPRTENQLYAAPNKFFESIADGVPPLAAPHPQCRQIIETHGCGLLLDDWSEDALVRGLDRAAKLYGTPQWDQMVANCEAAFRNELNWERQFEKVRFHLAKQP